MTLNRVGLDDQEIHRQIVVTERSLEGYEYSMEKHGYSRVSRTGDGTTTSVLVDSRHTTVEVVTFVTKLPQWFVLQYVPHQTPTSNPLSLHSLSAELPKQHLSQLHSSKTYLLPLEQVTLQSRHDYSNRPNVTVYFLRNFWERSVGGISAIFG